MTIIAADDPQAQSLIATALAPVVEVTPPPVVQAPLDPHVQLPGGLLKVTGEVVRDAEVRELNGADEEAISRVAGYKMYDQLLMRGVVHIGGEPVSQRVLDGLLIGDRDALLVAIRCATYGPTLDIHVVCTVCKSAQNTEFDLTADIPTRRLEDADPRVFTVDLRRGQAVVTLPTGATQRSLASSEGKTQAEINTLLLAACVTSINDEPVLNADGVRHLSVRDRATLIEALASRLVGPRLEEVSIPCLECNENVSVPLGLGDLFPL